MPPRTVQSLLGDIEALSPIRLATVEAVRALVFDTIESAEEEVKYGGILFSTGGVSFAGVFAYREHVSVEFGRGASIVDPLGFLQGEGKLRRHIKLRSPADVERTSLAAYLPLALAVARKG
jgi:hypothetical protein